MFAIDCTSCERRQLIFAGQVTGLVNDEQGIVVFYRCWCGAEGALRSGAAHTGRRARESLREGHALVC
jgi:hypothetical protein